MTQSWFYRHQGKNYGPVSAEELKKLADKGLLDPQDMVWPDGKGPNEAFHAEAAVTFARPPAAGALPDWLEDLRVWVSLEEAAGPTSARPPAPAPAAPTTPPPADAGDALAAKALADTGFDLKTGRVIDAAKFRRWQQQHARPAPNQPAATNAALLERFRAGRAAIEKWVADAKNRLRVLHADMDEIKKNPEVVAILQAHAKGGKEVQEKLLRHLEAVVRQRRDSARK
jgi:hypothetical protein